MIIASFFFVNKLEAKLSLNSHEYTVNQLKFATTLFRDFQKKYWFAATNICNQDRDYLEKKLPETIEYRFTARNICDHKSVLDISKISHTRIKFGLH